MAYRPTTIGGAAAPVGADRVEKRGYAAYSTVMDCCPKNSRGVSVPCYPTILSLRQAPDREPAFLKAGECIANHPVEAVLGCLPNDGVDPVFLPADGTETSCVAVSSSPDFNRCGAFAAAY